MKPADKIIPVSVTCLLWLMLAVMPVTSVAVDTFINTSSYFGGVGDERATAVATDTYGSVYITGQTRSSTLPNLLAGQTPPSGNNAFVTKIAVDGTVAFSRFIGTDTIAYAGDQETGSAIAVAADGAIYIAGSVASVNNFTGLQPTVGAYDGCDNGHVDGFLAVLENDGTLRYLTCFGGDAADYVTGMVLNSDSSATLVGYTHSLNFPLTTLAFQGQKGELTDQTSDAFIVRISPQGQGADDLLFSSYLGGAGADKALAVAADATGNLYITGSTDSADLPLNSDSNAGMSDIFATRLDQGTDNRYVPVYTRLLGGDGDSSDCEMGAGIAVDGQHVFITGRQAWVSGAGGQYSEAVIARLDVDGNLGVAGNAAWNLQTLAGSRDQDNCGSAVITTIGNAIVLDGSGGGLVTGVTMSGDLPAADVLGQGAYHGGQDGFVTRFDAGLNLLYTHYLGGSGDDAGYAIDRSAAGLIRVAGATASADLEVTDGSMLAGGVDVLSLALNADADLLVSAADQGPALFDEPLDFDLLLSNTGPDSAEAMVFELVVPTDFPGDVSLPTTSCTEVASGWSCPLGTLPGGAEVTLPVQLSSPQVGHWSFDYSLQASAYELHPENDHGQFEVELVDVLPLQIVDGSNTAGTAGGGAIDVLWLMLLLAIGYRNRPLSGLAAKFRVSC